MSPGDAIISVRGLEKRFRRGLFSKPFPALQGVSLEVGRGMVFGLLGPNGAGKTTFIKILLGLVRRWQGQALLFGQPAGLASTRRRVGYLPESHRLPGHLTGRQVLELSGMYSGRSPEWLDVRISNWIERVGMKKASRRKLREYSKGMQQRIGLAQALVHEPELVFLDEPTDGVDPVGRAVIREIVKELKGKGVTVFINSHLLMEVERVCDHIVIMSKGRIIREGTIEELTPNTGRVSFAVEASDRDLESLADGLGSGFRRTDGGFEIDLDPGQQNALIDRLRSAKVGIAGIARRKLTLEDTFIDLVKEGKEEAE